MLGFLEHHVREGALAGSTACLLDLGRSLTSAWSSICARFLDGFGPSMVRMGVDEVSEWTGGSSAMERLGHRARQFPTFGIATGIFGIFYPAIQGIKYSI